MAADFFWLDLRRASVTTQIEHRSWSVLFMEKLQKVVGLMPQTSAAEAFGKRNETIQF
jgi:hypothetical protein